MTLKIYSTHHEHYQGKQYHLAMIRDFDKADSGTFLVKNWGKAVDTEFNYGQVQAEFFADHGDAVTAYNREESNRASRGYHQTTMRQWDELSDGTVWNLQNKIPNFDSALSTVSGTTSAAQPSSIQVDEFGQPIVFNPTPAKKEVDPDAIPGPRTGGTKRLEWVMAHADHPQAVDQMMQVAQQMTTERDKAAATVASIENDLSFVNAWLQQTLATMVRS